MVSGKTDKAITAGGVGSHVKAVVMMGLSGCLYPINGRYHGL